MEGQKIPYYALVGEDVDSCLPDDRIYVFLTEEEMAKAFEQLTGYTLEQYKNNEYNYYTISEGFFYRVYEGIIGEM